MKQTQMFTLIVVFVMGMLLAGPGNGLTADTGMKEAGGTMMPSEGAMPEAIVEKNMEMMKEEMASGMPEPMPGEMKKKMDSEEMRQGAADDMNKEIESGAQGDKKMMH
jgi:hypothetical protein